MLMSLEELPKLYRTLKYQNATANLSKFT